MCVVSVAASQKGVAAARGRGGGRMENREKRVAERSVVWQIVLPCLPGLSVVWWCSVVLPNQLIYLHCCFQTNGSVLTALVITDHTHPYCLER